MALRQRALSSYILHSRPTINREKQKKKIQSTFLFALSSSFSSIYFCIKQTPPTYTMHRIFLFINTKGRAMCAIFFSSLFFLLFLSLNSLLLLYILFILSLSLYVYNQDLIV